MIDEILTAADRPLTEIAQRAGGMLSCWRDRARQRRQLARLDARQRADIGITRCDVARECAKPFWQA